MKKHELKPVEIYESENISTSDAYSVYNCAIRDSFIIHDFAEARKLAMEENTSNLVYAFNEEKENKHGASRFILLTPASLANYDIYMEKKNVRN